MMKAAMPGQSWVTVLENTSRMSLYTANEAAAFAVSTNYNTLNSEVKK